jgi:hypothetical protein
LMAMGRVSLIEETDILQTYDSLLCGSRRG